MPRKDVSTAMHVVQSNLRFRMKMAKMRVAIDVKLLRMIVEEMEVRESAM